MLSLDTCIEGRTMRIRLPAVSAFLVLLLLFSLCGTPLASHARADGGTRGSDTTGTWAEFRGNLNNTGYSTASVPANYSVALKLEIGAPFYSSPVIGSGLLFFGNNVGKVHAINLTTGSEAWSFPTGSAVYATPLVVGDTVYVGSIDSNMYALERSNGTQLWSFPTNNSISSSAKYVDGVIVFSSYDGNTYLLNATTGKEASHPFRTGGNIRGTPAIVNGTAIIGSNDGNVTRFRLSDLSIVWKFTLPMQWDGYVKYSSAAVSDDKVFIGSDDHNAYALDLDTGRPLWKFQTGAAVYASPGVHGGRVFVNSVDGNLYAVPLDDPDHDGNITSSEVLWTFHTGDGPEVDGGGSSPAIAGGRVFVSTRPGSFFVINEQTGLREWDYSVSVSQASFSSPAIIDGEVFVGLSDGVMYSFNQPATAVSIDVVPARKVAESQKAIELLFFVNCSGRPVEGALVVISVSLGTLSQYAATTLADGMQKVKYLPPKVSENVTVTISASAEKYPYSKGTSQASITVVPAQEYGTSSGDAFSLDKYQGLIWVIAALVAANVIVYGLVIRRRRSPK